MNNILAWKKQINTERFMLNNYRDDCIESSAHAGEKEQVSLIFSNNGMIFDCNQASADMLGCSPNELIGYHYSVVLSQLSEIKLSQSSRTESYLDFILRIGYCLEMMRLDETYIKEKLFFSDTNNCDQHYLCVQIYRDRSGITLTIYFY